MVVIYPNSNSVYWNNLMAIWNNRKRLTYYIQYISKSFLTNTILITLSSFDLEAVKNVDI